MRRALPQNIGIGHGWVEGGPLLPVKNEYYQAGLGVEALRALVQSGAARRQGRRQQATAAEFDHTKPALDQAFWSPEKKSYAFALEQNQPACGRTDRADDGADVVRLARRRPRRRHDLTLAAEDHQTDWGMRIISNQSKVYDGSGYHYGSVWPLFTGWASVGEYRYHRAFPAYSNLRSNALLGARRRARTFYRSPFRRLLPILRDQFAAPDLVRGDGGQSDSARDVWPADRRRKTSDHARSACSRGLDFVRDSQCARRRSHRRLPISQDGRLASRSRSSAPAAAIAGSSFLRRSACAPKCRASR